MTLKFCLSKDGLVNYTLEYAPVGEDKYTTFADSSSSVTNGVLGKFDPTLLKNGMYNIRLTGYGSSKHNVAEITVSVEGQMKIGNYSIAFNDMDIPVQGWPLTVQRGYDSRNKNKNGDFGYGWNLSLMGIKLSESCDPGNFWDVQGSGSFLISYNAIETRPHTISIDWGNGKVDKFKEKLSYAKSYQPTIYDISVSYTAEGSTKSKLEAIGTTSGFFTNSGMLLSTSGESYNPSKYKLTTEQGVVYIIDKMNGVESITDTNGNVITFTKDGITHSDGKSITFERNKDGNITKISGYEEEVSYAYDSNGDLACGVLSFCGAGRSFKNANALRNPIVERAGETEFKGKTVYQDDSLFNPNSVDKQGRTNIQRMEEGLAPIGKDGKSVNLHHVDQMDNGPIQEISATSHQQNYSDLHQNTGKSPSQINRPYFNKWRSSYWEWRASQYKK